MSEQSDSIDEARGIHVEIPGYGMLILHHLVLDLNGTLAIDGHVISGVAERLAALQRRLSVHVLTAGTHGHLAETGAVLGVQPMLVGTGAEKRDFVQGLGPEHVVAMGNGTNDALMFEAAALAIAVLGTEGLSAAALRAARVIVADPCAGLDLLLHPARLVATLRL